LRGVKIDNGRKIEKGRETKIRKRESRKVR
jgi:hypothetical protein